MRFLTIPLVVAAILAVTTATLLAQSTAETYESAPVAPPAPLLESGTVPIPYAGTQMYSGTYSVYGAPGYYGVAYGTASHGVPRTYTAFASSFGAGYGYGYAPYAYMPGRFGVGLWQPGLGGGGYVDNHVGYRTFAVPYHPEVVPPPLGYYAPGYGPPTSPN